jgi:hypothetical protein
MSDQASEPSTKTEVIDEDRRAFLNTYGKAALVAPPVITAMLATSMSSRAIAASTGGGGGGGDTGLVFLGAGAGAMPLVAAGGKQAAPVPPPNLVPTSVNLPASPAPTLPPTPPPPAPGPERGR